MLRVNISITPDGRVDRRGAADYLGLSAKTLSNWQTRGLGPPSMKIGGRVFYRLKDLEAFVTTGGKCTAARRSHVNTPCGKVKADRPADHHANGGANAA